MSNALIGLGANLGEPLEQLHAAVSRMDEMPHTRLMSVSRPFATPAIGGPAGQKDYLNAAAMLDTSLSATQLLGVLLKIEESLGRTRTEHWAPRTLDLDLLLFGSLLRSDESISIPHPRMPLRQFALAPASEIASEADVPGCGLTIGELYLHLRTASSVVILPFSGTELEELVAKLADQGMSVRCKNGELPLEKEISFSQEWELLLPQESHRELRDLGLTPRLVVLRRPTGLAIVPGADSFPTPTVPELEWPPAIPSGRFVKELAAAILSASTTPVLLSESLR